MNKHKSTAIVGAERSLVWLALAGALLGATGVGAAQAQEAQPVAIRFAAQVGDKPFACGQSYDNLGAPPSRATPTDFRFYVSDAELIDAAGKAVPVKLEQDGRWQYQDVALLDFENRSGPCLTGTTDLNDKVVGTVPKGSYKGLRFTLGVPFALNHADATIAPSPLNLTSTFWSWQGGYKFVRIDLSTTGTPQTLTVGETPKFGDKEASKKLGFAIHLGSTVCAAGSTAEKPTDCKNPNRPVISFLAFDPAKDVVVADLKGLLQGVNIDVNAPDTPAGCMSSPNDPDCNPLMKNFGLWFDDQPSGEQTFFRVQ
ncbi:MbnP family copper-binding protein [Ancylobacter lacus]|uniref:MbnP family copper-binding protein n=1 Tax=Ancylobacter lacus TaxID=2579970 RepID=UPI001BCAD23D|nr:MbnP family copper-binding protein [Ancylobacter lacus]MBS7538892.1 metallo-mystery pair system four-Cys motif protein [Ancylobacter lacus]